MCFPRGYIKLNWLSGRIEELQQKKEGGHIQISSSLCSCTFVFSASKLSLHWFCLVSLAFFPSWNTEALELISVSWEVAMTQPLRGPLMDSPIRQRQSSSLTKLSLLTYLSNSPHLPLLKKFGAWESNIGLSWRTNMWGSDSEFLNGQIYIVVKNLDKESHILKIENDKKQTNKNHQKTNFWPYLSRWPLFARWRPRFPYEINSLQQMFSSLTPLILPPCPSLAEMSLLPFWWNPIKTPRPGLRAAFLSLFSLVTIFLRYPLTGILLLLSSFRVLKCA